MLLSLSVVPPGIGAGTQGQNFKAPVLCSTKTKKTATSVTRLFLWCHQESNRGHKDFQSFALPTELWHQFAFSSVLAGKYHCCLFASAKVRRYLLSCKKMRNVLLIFIGYVDVSETLLCNFQEICAHSPEKRCRFEARRWRFFGEYAAAGEDCTVGFQELCCHPCAFSSNSPPSRVTSKVPNSGRVIWPMTLTSSISATRWCSESGTVKRSS